MNKKLVFLLIFLQSLSLVFISAQSSVKGSSVNGSTGLITTPTARIGWEYSDFGIDGGYSFLYNDQMDHVPRVTLSFLRKAEAGIALDIHENDTQNLLFHGKFQFFREGGSSVAIGLNGDFELDDPNSGVYLTPYLVASYSGKFFEWPAVTSMMIGWNMLEDGATTENFAFSMGFELALMPSVFRDYIYWISDFGNYSYSSNSMINAYNRGSFNSGIRIDPIKDGDLKFVIDLVGTDLLDSGRGFMASATLGMGL
jgi:hypothetical protein